MDRRSTLATLLGRKKRKKTALRTTSAGLEPYSGPWTIEQAAHLLRRATYCANYENMETAVQQGRSATVNQILADSPMPDPPVNYFYLLDPNVPVGSTWVDAPASLLLNFTPYRNRSLAGWTAQLMINDGLSIREKMVLFWHNHFVTGDIGDPRYVYDYSNLLRQHALGNFRELTKAITINPAMLRYLNGNQNNKNAPNENYARELLELFTLGKGELAGPGDYTTFTEDDVIEIARVLTGWRDTGYFDQQGNPVGAQFRPFLHDTGSKQLSARLGSATIDDEGENEYKTLIDLIFQQAEVARFISRKLYRWLVYYEIDDTVESEVIQPMADLLINNDFEIRPVLSALLNSAHFYDIAQRGCMIKNPMDFIINTINQFKVPLPQDLAIRYELGLGILQFAGDQLMAYYTPPNVAGWPAYYQEPAYYQLWINSVSLPQRMLFVTGFVSPGYTISGEKFIIDPLAFVDSIQNPSNVEAMIKEFATILFPQGVSDGQVDFLKETILGGLPDSVWQEEYLNYSADPGNETLAAPVRAKVQLLLITMLTMPENFLM